MNFFPYEHFSMNVNLTKEQTIEKLLDVTDHDVGYRFFHTYQRRFHGYFTRATFALKSSINYRNHFHLLILGKLEENNNRTVINIVIKYEWTVWALIISWITIWALFFILAHSLWLSDIGASTGNTLSLAAISLAMLVFGCVLFTWGFKFDSAKVKRFLTDLFKVDC